MELVIVRYPVKLDIIIKGTVQESIANILLPHELFGWLRGYNKELFMKLFCHRNGSGESENKRFWHWCTLCLHYRDSNINK